MKDSLIEKVQQIYRLEKVSLFSYIGSWGSRHTLKTKTKGGETYTVQGETIRKNGASDKDLCTEGISWARNQVGNNVDITYSNSKKIPLLEQGVTTVDLTLNEAYAAQEYEKKYRAALLG